MSTPRPSVANLPYDEASSGSLGPVQIDRRTPPFGLTELAAGFVHFPEGGCTDPWTLPYEESFYVIEGRLTLHVETEGEDAGTVVADAGEVVALHRGSTVRYEGTPGTRAFYSLVPADWASRI
jgi:ethanolamine utilization protein EutQ (cupin superfamily)